MRTTLDIDDDVLSAARERAKRDQVSIGEVISTLARLALTGQSPVHSAREPKAIYGIKPFPKRGGIISNEIIDKLREDDVY